MLEIPVSIGELFDKITILKIKQKYIQSEDKWKNVTKELKILTNKSKDIDTISIQHLIQSLETVNDNLWNLENIIRRLQHTDQEYAQTSVLIRQLNDERASIKRRINIIMKSEIIEEKEHT
jgi:predicted translin family RNA/ssDNA-binding protein